MQKQVPPGERGRGAGVCVWERVCACGETPHSQDEDQGASAPSKEWHHSYWRETELSVSPAGIFPRELKWIFINAPWE